MIILGIDPGVARTGYGVIKNKKRGSKKTWQVLDWGLILTPKDKELAPRLAIISKNLRKIIIKHSPDVIALETLFFNTNAKTVMMVERATGVALLAAAKSKIPVKEFTPLQIKITITGYGRAKKPQVQEMVKKFLKLKEPLKPDDVADALAVAICCGKSERW